MFTTSLGTNQVEFIINANLEKLKQLNRESAKYRPTTDI